MDTRQARSAKATKKGKHANTFAKTLYDYVRNQRRQNGAKQSREHAQTLSFLKKNGYPMGGETLAIFFSLNRLNTLFPRLLSIDSST